jgi:hypothetical protein
VSRAAKGKGAGKGKEMPEPVHLLLNYYTRPLDEPVHDWLARVTEKDKQQVVVRIIDVAKVRPTQREDFTSVDVRDHDRGGVHKYIVPLAFAKVVEMLGLQP